MTKLTAEIKAARAAAVQSFVMPTPEMPAVPESVRVDASEISIYALTSSEPVYRMMLAVQAALLKKIERGQYDPARALKAWRNVADFAAQEYRREYGSTIDPMPAFKPAARAAAAVMIARHHVEEFAANRWQ